LLEYARRSCFFQNDRSPAKGRISPAVRDDISCRETNLVLQALRAWFSGKPKCLESALAEPVDWTGLERIAEHHSVLPLVAYALTRYGGDLVPQEICGQLRQRLLLASHRNLTLIDEWWRILQAFDEAEIPVISLKGPALALLVYPNFAFREFTDLDLLVSPEEVPKARDLLVRNGYRPSSSLVADTDEMLFRSRNFQLDLVHCEKRICVDLHWGALHEMFSFQLPVDLLFKAARIEHYEGISFLALSPEHLLLYLCAHGTKHCWRSLRWLCDIACHVQRSSDLNWRSCIRCAETSNCELVLKHSLLLAQQILGLDLPPEMASYCEAAKVSALIATASSFLFCEDEDLSYGQTMRFHLVFARNWRDRAAMIFERIFVPAESDWQQLRLPRPLHFLYYMIRPIRFMRERIRLVAGRTV
jgi:Uncharacterised nucleotidyltransferase